ncbi:hypothetical protein JCGZ_24053 [Jatropha curcas]|uniref:Uncharacterized protein n=1 Tax=Jatropha curcas TaxID=180498 RepID=A0A067LQJ8_JATCU|nr:hypothetical protein JCGZ_24053 [Jatropha curcas]
MARDAMEVESFEMKLRNHIVRDLLDLEDIIVRQNDENRPIRGKFDGLDSIIG